MQPEELSEYQIIYTDTESGCHIKDEDVPEEMMPAQNFPLKEFSETTIHRVQRIKYFKLMQTLKGVEQLTKV